MLTYTHSSRVSRAKFLYLYKKVDVWDSHSRFVIAFKLYYSFQLESPESGRISGPVQPFGTQKMVAMQTKFVWKYTGDFWYRENVVVILR